MKKITLIFFLVSFITIFAFSQESIDTNLFAIKEENFSSPEMAIEHFIDALKRNDISGMLESCAINEQAEKVDLTFKASLLKSYQTNSPLPPEYAMYRDINRLAEIASILNQVKYFIFSFLVPDTYEKGIMKYSIEIPYGWLEETFVSGFVKATNPSLMEGLRIVRICDSNFGYSQEFIERHKTNLKKEARTVGADEAVQRIILYEKGDEYFYGGFTLLRYGPNWKIKNMSHVLIDILNQPAKKTTLQQFDAILLGDSE